MMNRRPLVAMLCMMCALVFMVGGVQSQVQAETRADADAQSQQSQAQTTAQSHSRPAGDDDASDTAQSQDHALARQWISAIGNDEAETLRALFTEHRSEALLNTTASNGKNALMVAAKEGDLPLVRTLVQAGAKVDATTLTHGTAFMFAVLGNRQDVAQWLLGEGADINVVGSNGWTATTIAAAKGYLELLEWLIEQGARTEVRDVYRYTPLMRAVENDHEAVVALLLSLEQTGVNAQDEYENSSLHHSVSANNETMVRLLMEAGADARIPNRDGLTPLMLARGKPVIRQLLGE